MGLMDPRRRENLGQSHEFRTRLELWSEALSTHFTTTIFLVAVIPGAPRVRRADAGILAALEDNADVIEASPSAQH